MDGAARLGRHARTTYAEVAAAGSAVRPLEFPAPTVHRGARITALACDEKSGQVNLVRNFLVRLGGSHYRHSSIGSSMQFSPLSTGFSQKDDEPLEQPSLPEVGYHIRKKLADCIYGSVRLCVVMKQRKRFLLDNAATTKDDRGTSLEKINEHDDWDEGRSSPESYVIEDEIIWEPTGELVAVKISSWSKLRRMRGRHLEDPVKEVAANQLLGDYHPHVLGNIDVLQDNDYLYSICPYCDDGDLFGLISEVGARTKASRLSEDFARIQFKQILMGLYHFQKKGVCHRDLSLENILLHKNSIKIIDTGIALRVPYSDPSNRGGVTDVSAGTTRCLMQAQGQGGSFTFMAPEVLLGQDFDGFAIDLWAAAVILFIMLIGYAPFKWAHDSDRWFVRMTSGYLKDTLDCWEITLSDEAVDLLQNMLWRGPRQRFTLGQVLEHPWMQRHGVEDEQGTLAEDVAQKKKHET